MRAAKWNIDWIDTTEVTSRNVAEPPQALSRAAGSQRFWSRGVEGKIECVRYARENKIPYLGICLGFQMAVIEYARNVCNIPDADSMEFAPL